MKILVTGQSGVGKSSLLSRFKYYSFDDQNNEVWIKKGSPYYNFVSNNFGKKYVDKIKINKKLLGNFLFTNNKALDKLNKFVIPFVREWIKSLPSNSIIEFAQYINNEKSYSDLFDKVILITNDSPNLDKKFNYLHINHQPINNQDISCDFLVNNSGFKGQKKFDKIIKDNFEI